MWWRAPWLKQRWTLLGLAIFDCTALVIVYNVVFFRRFGYWAGITGSPALVSGMWLIISYLLGRYSLDEQSDPKRSNTILSTILTASACTISIAILSWLFNSEDPRAFRSFVAPAAAYGAALSYIGQRVKLSVERRPGEECLIVGNQEEIAAVSREIVALHASKRPSAKTITTDTLDEEYAIDLTRTRLMAISDRLSISQNALDGLLILRERGAKIQNLITWCEGNLQRVPPELLTERWMVIAEGFGLRPGSWSWRVKRLGDITVACLLLAGLLPVIAVAAVAIVIDDGGPIFYSQVRTGLNGGEFRIWKLRTMSVTSEEDGPQWAKKDDPRITKVGSWLRKTRVDELPQLISVLTGEMSLIGPRPERPEIEEELESILPHYRIRHWIRPGLSGWAQVCYPYGASIEDSRKKLSYDIFYLRNASISLDILILIKTIRLVFLARGANPNT